MQIPQKPLLVAIAAGLALLTVPACEQKKPATEEVKDAVNDALDRRPAEGVRDAAEDIKEGVKDAANAVKEDVKK